MEVNRMLLSALLIGPAVMAFVFTLIGVTILWIILKIIFHAATFPIRLAGKIVFGSGVIGFLLLLMLFSFAI